MLSGLILFLAVMRRLLLVSAGLLGAACVGTDARWSSENAGQFRWSLMGSTLWQGDRVELVRLVEQLSPWLFAGGILLALLVGFRAARSMGRAGMPAGLVLAALFFFSVDPGTLQFVATRGAGSAARYLDVGDLVRALGWGAFALAVMGWFVQPRSASDAENSEVEKRKESERDPAGSSAWVVVACLIASIVPIAFSQFILNGEPLTNDGAAYRYQAELFERGELSRDIGDLSDFFPARQIQPGPLAFSKYPPGHSAVLALGGWLGLPWLLPGLLAALVPFLTWLIARRCGLRTPHRAALLVAISPALLGVQSLWLSHATSVPMCLLFAYAVLAASDEIERHRGRAILWGLLGGFAISVAFTARPLTAVAVALPFVISIVLSAGPRAWSVSVAAFLAFLPGAGFFLWINQQLTGSPLQTAYGLYSATVSPNDRWGLVNLGTALEYTRFNLARLSAWMNGFAPGLWLIALGTLPVVKPRRAHLLWLPALSLLGFYALHRFQGVPWVGPLYLAEAVPLLAVLSAAGWNVVEHRWGKRAVNALACVMVLASTQLLASHFLLAGKHVESRGLPQRLAREQGVESGVVFIPIEDEASRRRFALPPPHSDEDLIFARDRGAKNAELLTSLGNPEAWILDLEREELFALTK